MRDLLYRPVMGVRHILAAAASMLSAILFAASCGGDRPSTPSSPLASTASPAPKPTFGALPTPTGIAEIDEVVRATLAGDSGALIRMLAYERLACVIPQQEGSPPGCRNGETAGTVVDALLVGGCGGNYLRTDEAERVISGTVTTAGRALYAVFRPGGVQGSFRLQEHRPPGVQIRCDRRTHREPVHDLRARRDCNDRCARLHRVAPRSSPTVEILFRAPAGCSV